MHCTEIGFVLNQPCFPKRYVSRTACKDIIFSASSAGTSPHFLCGVNSGEHMYLEASESCNTLQFDWTDDTVTREWNIHIMQVT